MRTSAARLPTGNLAILLAMSLSEQMPLADVKNRVPTLHVNGGGTSTREDAERDCLSAIAQRSSWTRLRIRHRGHR